MHGMLRRMLGPADAEDALQESWLRAARALGRFRGDSALRTWLTAIAINHARELLRARGRWEEGAAEEAASTGPWPPLDLERAVGRLAPGYRLALLLHDAWGYTHEEIAGMLGIEPGTSKSQLSHARRVVRSWLAGGERKP